MSNSIRSLYVDIRSNHERAVSGLREVEDAGDDAAGSLGKAEESSDNLARRQQALQTALKGSAAATLALGGALSGIVSVGSEVEDTFATVGVTSGASTTQMEAMREEAARIGAELPISAADAAGAFQELTYAGLDAEEAIAAVGSVSDLAVGGNIELAQSSRIVTSALNQYNLEADQAGTVTNTLASTFATSATDIDELSQAFDYVGTAAAGANQSVTQTNALLGSLADNGLRGSRAGTSLAQALQSLADPSDKAADALSQVGLSQEDFLDSEGEWRDMTDIVAILSSKLEDMPSGQRSQILSQIFGTRGRRAIEPLIGNVDELNEKLEQVAGADVVGALDQLEDISEEDLAERLDGLTVELSPEMDREEALGQFVALRDELNQEELEAEIQTALNVDEDAAEILASDIEAGAGAGELADSLDDIVTGADLAGAKMETFRGQIRYIIGSLQSFAYTAYQSVEPALQAIAGVFVNFVDLLNENENVARAFGVGLLAATGAAATLTTGISLLLGELYLTQFATAAAAKGTYTYQAAQYAAAGASKANALAQMGLRGALMATAGGFKAAAIAAKGFMVSMGPLGWALLAGSAALSAYVTNAFGLKDAVDQLLAPLGSFAGFLWDITKSGIGTVIDGLLAPFRAIGSVIRTVIEMGTDLLAWFDSLGPVGRAPLVAIATAINPVLGGFLMLRNALEYIGPAADVAGSAIRALGRGGLWLLKTVFWPLIAAGKGIARVGQWIAGGLSAAAGAYADFTGAIESGPGRALTATLDAIGGASAWVENQLSKLASATGTFFRVLSLFSPPGLVYWLTQAVTGSEDLAEKFGPLEPIMSRVFGAARFVGGALRELYDIGQLFGDWIIGRAIGWLNSQVDAARAKFDSFKQGVYEAIDPFIQLYNWMERIIDKVPDLPSKEDIPLVGGLLDGGGEVTDANASAEEEGRGFMQSAWDSVAGDGALPSVEEMRAETEDPTPGDIEESRVTGPEDREAPPEPAAPQSPEAPPAPEAPEAPTGPVEPETPVQPETQGVDSPMDAADPYAEGQQAGEQTAEGVATGIDKRMEIARQSAADLNQGVQEEAGGEVTGPDVRPGEQFDPESMPEQTPPEQEREVQTTDQRRVEYRETGGLESVPDPEPAERRVETDVETPEQPTYDEYRVGTEVQTPQEPDVQTDQKYEPAHQPPDAEAPAIPEVGNYEPGVEQPEPESPDLQTDEDHRIDVEAAMAQQPAVETEQEYEPEVRPPEARPPELPQAGTFEPTADTSELERTQQVLQSLQETTDEDLDIGELDTRTLSDARESVQAFREALPGGTYEDEVADVFSTLQGEISQFSSQEDINAALDTVEETVGIEIDRDELSTDDIRAATESMHAYREALPGEGTADDAAGGIMAIHDRFERVSEETYEPEVTSPDVTPPEIPEAQTEAEDYEPGFVEPEADPSFETDASYEPGIEEPEAEGPTSMPDRSPEVVGQTGYTPAVEAEPETPSVESATLENAAEGSDRARQFFPETQTDEETGETQEVYQEVPDTVAEMPPDLRAELRASNTEDGEGVEQPPAPESPTVDVDPAESPDVSVASNPEVTTEQPDVQTEVQPGPAQRGTVSPQQPESPQGPAMAAAGGGQAAVAAGAADRGLVDAYQDLPEPRAESMRGVADRPQQPSQDVQSPSVDADVSRSSGEVSVNLTVDQNITLNIDNMDGLVDSDELEQFGRELQDRTETAVENGILDSLEMTPRE